MTEFLQFMNLIYKTTGGRRDNITELPECISKIPESLFHCYLLIPSVLTTLSLACTMTRKNKWLTRLGGRPGAVFPMNIIGKSHRFLYAAAWGSIAFLATDLILGFVVIVELSGPPYVTVFNKVLSMIIIGVDYFPMFAALALESVTGYMIGTAYAWMLLIVQIFTEAECELAAQARLVLFFRDLPNLICLGYLSISLPVRAIWALRKTSIGLISSSERVSVLKLTKKAEFSSEAKHVKSLLKPLPPPTEPPSTCNEKLIAMLKTFVSDWIYQSKHGFKYSARMLSVMVIGLMLIYKVTLEVTVFIVSFLKLIQDPLQKELDEIGWSAKSNETQATSDLRQRIYIFYDILTNGKICFIVAISLACVGSVLTILHMLSSYRTNLLALYKGDNTHIPSRSTLDNSSLLTGSIKYAGYQVAYIAWGFILQLIVLFLSALVISIIIALIRLGIYQWILTLLSSIWPAVLMTILVMLAQTILTKYAFLQENGEVLAIDNRRVLFSFTFFMFFYNIFIGLLSCLLRIIKSVVIGTIFLPRLDNSALPRRFQMLDPGFSNYCGFMHVECAHTHPVMITFLRLLMIDAEKSKSEGLEMHQIVIDINDTENQQKPSISKSRARARWLLLYTLHNNPTIRVFRKSYLDYVKSMQERLTRNYKLNTTAMGNLVKNVNNVFINNDKDYIDDTDETTNAHDNWNALFAMHKFLQQIQKDVAKKKISAKICDEESVQMNNRNTKHDDKVNDVKDENLSSDTSDVASGTSKQFSTDKNVHTKSTKNLWKRGAFLSLANKDTVHPTSEQLKCSPI